MGKIHDSITELIGHTPLVRLHRLEKAYGLEAEIVVKLEFFNPTQNVKERIALSMIEGAEARGELKEGYTIIDLTSGNTGISLAAVAAAKGYKFHAYVQDTASKENKQLLSAYGADYETIFTNERLLSLIAEAGGDFTGVIGKFITEAADKPDTWAANQVENLDNPKAHRTTTGPEIWEDTDGNIDFFISGAGTGGTLLGAGGFLREKSPGIKIIAYQPGVNSRPFENKKPEQPELLGVHPIAGVPYIAPLLRGRDVYDEIIDVEAPDAYDVARAAAKLEGILVGESSGAALYTAILLAHRPENKGKRIVALLADSGVHYLSTPLFGEQ
jgi:cysteine synthase A